MSTGLWVTGPGGEFVAEDHVWALNAFVLGISQDIAKVAQSVTHHAQYLEQDVWADTSAAEVRAVATEIHALVADATWLARALSQYAHRTAAHEQARARVLGAPAERLIALALVLAVKPTTRIAVGEADIPLVAGLLLGNDFEPDDVAVWQVPGRGRSTVLQATGVEQRVARIPTEGASIRIERYESGDGSFATEVFIAGTKEWGRGQTAEPFDVESNFALVAGVTSSSVMAVEMAMKRLGVRPGDRVTFVGHSQGGVIATRLAESGRYNTTGLVTVGAPMGLSPVTGDYQALVIAHTDDVVPRLAGQTDHQAGWQIERHSGGRPGDVVGAHSLERYIETARVMDASKAADHWGDWAGSGRETRPALFTSQRVGFS